MTQAVCRGQGSSGAEPQTLPHLTLASSTVSRGRELTHEASFHPTTRSYNQLIFIEHLQMPGPVLDSAGGGAAGGGQRGAGYFVIKTGNKLINQGMHEMILDAKC